MNVFEPGSGVIFMRVGTHADEPLAVIVGRKLREIEVTGHAFWGYGGQNCHPRSVVQPYAEEIIGTNRCVRLCMEEVAPDRETYWAEAEPATEWSIDGITFRPLPSKIRVVGSRYAFIISNLRKERLDLRLDHVRVAAGPSRGRLGADYIDAIGGAVDKAVLRVEDSIEGVLDGDVEAVPISYVADLLSPFAVFLR